MGMKKVDNELQTALHRGFETAFIDSSVKTNLAYLPGFVSNNPNQGSKVISTIEYELLHCDAFAISVAFVTMGGITPLLSTLKELERKHVPGRILTTDYLTFTQPEALTKLASLENIDLRMYETFGEGEGFHTKGYIFKDGEIYRIVVGSSNMTLSALTTNKEWNTKLVSTEDGAFAQSILDEFDDLWNSPKTKPYAEVISNYEERYRISKEQRKIAAQSKVVDMQQYKLQPNDMQVQFTRNLKMLQAEGATRALLISATGTGKTYASAFAMRDNNPRKMLFVVHRELIAKQAKASYERVFGKNKKFGLLSGSSKDYDADYLFSTMNMMAREDVLERFRPDEFDTIVIDEVHRAGASSYERIIDHFKPRLLLGMTASPERTDGFDIFSLFDHNIAHEIRLQQAMENDLLCPFHYFGITDLMVDGKVIDEETGFSRLVSDARVDHVIEQAEYYGHSGNRVKGLVFCSRKDEARELSEKFNERGYRTVALTGEDSPERREEMLDRLASDTRPAHEQLDYVFAVDILNEGIDIVELNQIIMLRPTQSPIIFVQQLGRGLRKAKDKEYVVILDFIGNYTNNFMIPVALSGDRSYNKDNMRKFLSDGTRVLAGSSSIHFDEISRKRIYASIDAAKTNDMKLLKDSYRNLKYKLGHIPSLQDFVEHGEIDATKIFEKCGSYYEFLVKYEDDYTERLTAEEAEIIKFISTKLAKGKRVHELELLRMIIEEGGKAPLLARFRDVLSSKYGIGLTFLEVESVARVLMNEFGKEQEKKDRKHCVFIERVTPEEYVPAERFLELLKKPVFKEMIAEVVRFGIGQYELHYSHRYKDMNLQLYQKYTYEDVCRLLNWNTNVNAQNIGGYKYDAATKTLPVFINYDKEEDAIAYEDRFVSSSQLIALSKHPRKVDSADADHIYKRTPADKDNRIFLFVRKNKDDQEAKEFYFLGEMEAKGEPHQIFMESTGDNAFEIDYNLDRIVREDLYEYITEG